MERAVVIFSMDFSIVCRFLVAISQVVKHPEISVQTTAVGVITSHESQGSIAIVNAEFHVRYIMGVVVSHR
jgi:hypothetical protein